MNTKEKGDQLENAIERLEKTILGKYIGAERPEISIERNKIFVVDDVEYRPDLVITLYPNTDYESVIIFECKNWKDLKVKR
ncbi:hypothetical protein [Fulvivirga sp.]